jgi:hypothetical protein
MDRLGGHAAWGVVPGTGARVVIDPGRFAERLFPEILGLLNKVMAATPPACIHGEQPIPDSGNHWYSENNQLSVSYQLGF